MVGGGRGGVKGFQVTGAGDAKDFFALKFTISGFRVRKFWQVLFW